MRSTSCGSGVPTVELLADLDVVAVGDQQARPLRDRVLDDTSEPSSGVTMILRGLVGLLDRDPAGGLRDRRSPLGTRASKSSTDAGQTLGDVVAGHTTGVEGTHRQLGAGLTDRLGRDDADGLADVDQLAGGQRAAVALGAGAGSASQVSTERTLTSSMPAATSSSILTSPRSSPAGDSTSPSPVGDVDGRDAGVRRGLDVLVLDAACRPRPSTRSACRCRARCRSRPHG